MFHKIKEFYYGYIKTKLANQIIFIVTIICIFQMMAAILMYLYSYQERKDEVIENNIQILQQANNNYLSIIVEDLSAASRELFYDEVFWGKGDYSSSEDNRIYSILAGKFHSIGNIDSIYLFSSKSNKFYIMDEMSFSGIPVRTIGKNSFLSGYEDLKSENWFDGAVKNDGAAAVSRNREIRNGSRDIISFSRYLRYPLKPQDNYYVVAVNMEEEQFAKLRKQLCSKEEALVILDDKGNYIYGNAKKEIWEKMEENIDRKNSAGTKWYQIKVQGKTYIVICNTAETGKWTMLKVIPKETVIGSVRNRFIGNCLIILLLFFTGITVLYYVISAATKPIEKLAGTMRHYRQGSRKKEIKPAGRADEVGILYTSFEAMNERIDQLISLEYQSKINEKQARLEALQAQLDPHFLYNTLQTISAIAIEKNVLEIEQINNCLSSILHYSLNKNKSIVVLDEELKNVKNYMEIQKIRYGDRLSLHIELSEDALKCMVPVFTLQLAVENSIKHGLELKTGTEIIEIYDKRLNEKTQVLYVRDNGSGIEDERLKEIHESLNQHLDAVQKRVERKGYEQKGLINLNERIKQYFGTEYGIEIENNMKEGVLLSIFVPSESIDVEKGKEGVSYDPSHNCRR